MHPFLVFVQSCRDERCFTSQYCELVNCPMECTCSTRAGVPFGGARTEPASHRWSQKWTLKFPTFSMLNNHGLEWISVLARVSTVTTCVRSRCNLPLR